MRLTENRLKLFARLRNLRVGDTFKATIATETPTAVIKEARVYAAKRGWLFECSEADGVVTIRRLPDASPTVGGIERDRRRRYAFDTLVVGASMFVPLPEEPNGMNVRVAASQYGMRHGVKLAVSFVRAEKLEECGHLVTRHE